MKTVVGNVDEPSDSWEEQQRKYREQYQESTRALGRAFRAIPTTLRVVIPKIGRIKNV